MKQVSGIHHITAISGDAQENLDFYVGVLGMRLVKKSINQDAPDTYHLFFADGDGNPGTDLTFFPWPNMPPGKAGSGVWGEVQLGVPENSLEYWKARLTKAGVSIAGEELRFGEKVLPFRDPHGTLLALVEAPLYEGFTFAPWENSPVPEEMQIRVLAGAHLPENDIGATAAFLESALGLSKIAEEGGLHRYGIGAGEAGRRIDLYQDARMPTGRWGVGSVHHVAWRVADEPEQSEVRSQIMNAGVAPTERIDRFWFKSVYCREPGGAVVEIATDGPGFAVDEDPQHLGEKLVLPPAFEANRARIESMLPILRNAEIPTL